MNGQSINPFDVIEKITFCIFTKACWFSSGHFPNHPEFAGICVWVRSEENECVLLLLLAQLSDNPVSADLSSLVDILCFTP